LASGWVPHVISKTRMWTSFRDLVNAATWDRQRPFKSLIFLGPDLGPKNRPLVKMPSYLAYLFATLLSLWVIDPNHLVQLGTVNDLQVSYLFGTRFGTANEILK
jgi:hypothetical protein